MALPVTVYAWSDPGAPQLSSTMKTSEIINVLKKVLVDGYGTKQPLGWTMPFEDAATAKAVFRNSTTEGSGGAFQIWSAVGTDPNNGATRIQPAANITALDTYDRDGFYQTIQPEAAATNWYIIGTSAGIYLCFGRTTGGGTLNGSTSTTPVLFIGDFESLIPNDAGRFILIMGSIAGNSTSSGWNNTLTYLSSTQQIGKIYDADGSVTFSAHRMGADVSPGSSFGVGGVPTAPRVFIPYPLYNLAGASTTDPDGERLPNSTKRPYVRGVLPGLYLVHLFGYNDQPLLTTETHNGIPYMALHGYNPGSHWIRVDQWYE